MKSVIKTAFRLGVLATITVAGTVYYYLKKNSDTPGALLDRSIDSLENAAYEANIAFRDAQTFAQNKARSEYKNVNYHAVNMDANEEEGTKIMDSEAFSAVKDIKKNVKKRV